MKKVVIAGCGAIAQKRYAPAIYIYPGERIKTGFFDPVSANAESLATQYGGTVYNSLEAVLQDREVSAVLVCTPEKYHCDTVIACLEAGKHVLCEKPMAMDADQARRMVRAQKRSGKELAVAFSQRHYEEHQTAKRLIKEGTVGKPFAFRTFLSNPGVEHFIRGDAADFYDRRLDDVGGVMLNVGCHRVDLIPWMFEKRIDQVLACTPTLDKHFSDGRPIAKEDTAMVIMKLEDGISGMLWTSWCNYGAADADTQIFGTQGSMKICSEGKVVLEKADGSRAEITAEKTEYQQSGYEVVWNFLDFLTTGKRVAANALDGLACMETLDAVRRSNLSGHWEAVYSFQS